MGTNTTSLAEAESRRKVAGEEAEAHSLTCL